MFHRTKYYFEEKPMQFVIIAVVLGVAAGFVVSLLQKSYVEASQSFTVRNERHAAGSVYDYEGFYTLQTANETAKVLTGWLTSPGGVRSILGEAGIVNKIRSMSDYGRVFTVKRDNSPFFEVQFDADTTPEAERISASMEELIRKELASFQNSASLSLGASGPVLTPVTVPFLRNVMYGGLLCGFMAAFVLLFKKAMERE